jgi:N-hydroxyarylamine O-acetyltransferase
MPAMPLDLTAYLRRIGLGAPNGPDLATLAAVQRAHAQAIAFENLDPWTGRTVALDLGALQDKLVARRRGGFCYEHNLLLGAALRAIGFAVVDLAARVRWNVVEGLVRPRTHMLLLVALDGERFVVDAGFGGMTMTAPLRLDRRGPQPTPHGTFRLHREDGSDAVQVDVAGAWKTLYTFTHEPQLLPDYELTSWYLCHHPESIFRRSLIAARPTSAGRWTLRDLQLTLHHLDGRSETQTLRSVAEVRQALEGLFGIEPAQIEGLDARIAELVVSRSGA